MTAYDADLWAGLALAVAGAAAVLTGLLLVVLASIAVRAESRLPGGPALTLCVLGSVLVGSLALLVPGQDVRTLGLELAVLGLALAVVVVVTASNAPDSARRSVPESFVLSLAPAAALVVGGVSLTTGQSGGGLYWVAAGFVVGLVGAVRSAWLLLVGLNR